MQQAVRSQAMRSGKAVEFLTERHLFLLRLLKGKPVIPEQGFGGGVVGEEKVFEEFFGHGVSFLEDFILLSVQNEDPVSHSVHL